MAEENSQLSPDEAKLLLKAIEEAEREEAEKQQQNSASHREEQKSVDGSSTGKSTASPGS